MSRLNDTTGQGQSSSATDQLRDKAAEVTQNVREIGSQIRDAAKEKYENVRSQANDYYDQGRAKAQEFESSIESYVQEKPVKALLIAAGVGLVLGILWKRS
jgi:ElaB/YqjD/DUF883 family membrane-anchored ribosome-binding protein